MSSRLIPAAMLLAAACSSGEGTFGGPPRADGGTDEDANGSVGGRSMGGSGTGGTRRGTGGRATGGAGAGGTSTRDASTDATTNTGGRAPGSGGGAADSGAAGGSSGAAGASGSGGAAGATGSGGAAGTSGSGGAAGASGSGGAAGATGSGGACNDEPDAAASVACSRNADCCVTGFTCSGFVFTNPVTVHCHAPFPGGAAIGTACTGALGENPACATGVCSASFGSCTTRCVADADCGAPGFMCRGVTVNGTPMSLCARACTGDGSCLSGQICVLRDSVTLDRLEKYCRPKPTTGSAPGTTSTDASTCDHGNTVVIGQDQYCTAPCDVNADCPAAVGKCQKFTFSTPVTNTNVQSGLCVKP